MDSGVAALLGAVAGAIGTCAAAFLNSWATRKQTELSVRAEDARQIREDRKQAYNDFCTAAFTIQESLHPHDEFLLTSRPADLWYEEWDSALRSLKEARIRVALLGSSEVSKSASDVVEYAGEVEKTLERTGGTPEADQTIFSRSCNLYLRHLDEFLRIAQPEISQA